MKSLSKLFILCLVLLVGLNVGSQKLNASEVSSNYELPDVGVIQENGNVTDLEGNKIGNVPKGYLNSNKANDGKYDTGYDISKYSSTRYGQILMLVYGGKWYVCIEPTADTNGNGSSGSSAIWNSLSYSQKNKIGLAVSYTGSKIGSISPTDTNDKQWVAASQLYVWNVIDDDKYSDSAIANDGAMGSKFSEIKEYVRYSSTLPSFSGSAKNAVWDNSQNRYEVVFTDTNNVLAKQNKITPYPKKVGDWNVEIKDGSGSDTMTLYSTNKYANGYAFTKANYNYIPIGEGASNSGSRYVNFGDQSAMLGGNLVSMSEDPLGVYFNVNMPSSSYNFGKAELWKENQNDLRLKGVQFKVYKSNGSYVETITTDSTGHAVTSELEAGNYYIVESSTGSNTGITLNEKHYNFNITGQSSSSANPTNIIVENNGIYYNTQKGKAILTKEDQHGNKLSGVIFDIYNSSNVKVESITTDTSGIATTSFLSSGSYYAIESSVGNNQVELDKITKYNFTITGGTTSNPSNEPVNIGTIKNVNKGRGKLTKTNQNDDPLVGIQFKVYDTSDVLVDTITTDTSGVATTKYLSQGSYYAIESSVGSYTDISLDSTTHYPFKITGSIEPDKVSTKNIINQQYGNVDITEISSAMNEEKVIFKIKQSGNFVEGKNQVKLTIKNNGTVIYDELVTFSKGEEKVLTLPIAIIESDNVISASLSNVGGSLYHLSSLDNTRYAPSSSIIDVNVASGSKKVDTPIGQVSTRSGDKNYYETISIDGFDLTYDVLDGRMVFDYSVRYGQDEMPYIKNSLSVDEFNKKIVATMYQPLDDSTLMFDKNINGMYELPMQMVNGKLVFKGLEMESDNGRIYLTSSDLYNNPTSEQKKLYEGYRDETDTMLPITNVYLTPIYNTDDLQGKTYNYSVEIKNVGLNNITLNTHQSFNFDKKLSSTKEGLGKYWVNTEYPTEEEIKEVEANGDVLGEYIVDGKNFSNTKTWFIKEDIYDQIYHATDISKLDGIEVVENE